MRAIDGIPLVNCVCNFCGFGPVSEVEILEHIEQEHP